MTAAEAAPDLRGPKRARKGSAWHRLVRDRAALLGLVVVLLVVVGALFAQDLGKRLLPPSWLEGGEPGYLLGGDPLGRDILSRIIYGARISLMVGVIAVLIRGTGGVLLGLLSGYKGGWFDSVVMRFGDIQMALPFLVLALAIMAVLGPGLRNVIIVLGITGWVFYARVVRSEVLSLREREFVDAARVVGARTGRILSRHILPNAAASVIVVATLDIALMIILEASLSDLGMGVQPPTPSWGSMVADGRDYLSTQWWVSTFPGLAIFVTVMAINLVGDWLRDVLDPTTRGTG
jgi:peptide/nickel transport system permease protein